MYEQQVHWIHASYDTSRSTTRFEQLLAYPNHLGLLEDEMNPESDSFFVA